MKSESRTQNKYEEKQKKIVKFDVQKGMESCSQMMSSNWNTAPLVT